MTQERVNEIVKSIFGNTYFVEKSKGPGIYKVRHTIGINGAVASGYGCIYDHGNYLRLLYVWKRDAEPIANNARAAGFEVTMDYYFDFWVVKVYDNE